MHVSCFTEIRSLPASAVLMHVPCFTEMKKQSDQFVTYMPYIELKPEANLNTSYACAMCN